MFTVGLQGMPRRVADYAVIFERGNQIATAGAYIIFFGMLLFMYAMISSWISGKKAPINPWGSQTLEWTVRNPIPLENFDELPVVTSDPYRFGEKR
jgi:cytochrome c oxidase subunit 1